MSKIAIEKPKDGGVSGDVEALLEQVRDRAYGIFLQRGERDGSAIDDWLQAESELILQPESDLAEANGEFRLRVAVPGYSSDEVHVSAAADAVVVRAKSSHAQETGDGSVKRRELEEKTLLRRFDLPQKIDADQVTANLDDGMLSVTAPKLRAPGRAAAQSAS